METKTLVTGGAGFIGSHMVDLLIEQGFHVNIIDNFVGGSKKNLKHLENNSKIKVWNEDIRSLKSGHEAFGAKEWKGRH